MIEARNIVKQFNNKTVLDDVSITFEQGKINLIIGASGSGKTVLTKCLVGLFDIDSGEIYYDGKNFIQMDTKDKSNIRKEIGMMFQGGALFDSLTVEENVKFPLTMFTNQREEEMLDRVNFCLQRVDLENANTLYPSELSGGMIKRVAIARAIAMQPKYLFCDEPDSGLDPKTSVLINILIKEITREFDITTVVITHNMNSVMEIGDNIAFIYKGKKCWEGNKDEILYVDKKEVSDFVYASDFMKRLKDKI